MLEKEQKNFEPIMLKFLREEGIIPEGVEITFEWKDITNRTIKVDIEVLMTALLGQAKAISELNNEKEQQIKDIIKDLKYLQEYFKLDGHLINSKILKWEKIKEGL